MSRNQEQTATHRAPAMYYAATFYKDKHRDGKVSRSIIGKDGFIRRHDTDHTSLRQAVTAFLCVQKPMEFCITEERTSSNSSRSITVYYRMTVEA